MICTTVGDLPTKLQVGRTFDALSSVQRTHILFKIHSTVLESRTLRGLRLPTPPNDTQNVFPRTYS